MIAGVLPLVSGRHAAFLHNEVPGIDIPEARPRPDGVRPATSRPGVARPGRAMATELAGDLRAEGVAGIYVMPQFGRYDRAAEVVEAIRAG